MSFENSTPKTMQQLLQEQHQLLTEIYDRPIEETDAELLDALDTAIKNKADAYVSIIKKDGLIDKDIQQLKERIEAIQSEINTIEKRKEFMKRRLYHIAHSNGGEFDTGTNRIVAKPGIVRKIDIEKVPQGLLTYTVKLPFELYNALLETAEESGIKIGPASTSCTLETLEQSVSEGEKHEAIIETPTFNVGFYKSKLKVKPNESSNKTQSA